MLLTVEQTAQRLHVHPKTVRAWIARGTLPAQRLGARSVRIEEAAVEALLRPIPTAAA